MFAKMFIVVIIVLILKGFIENIVAYIQFRLNPRLAIGVRVNVRGKDGIITGCTLNWIFVKHKEGTEIILVRRWRFEKWALLSNGD
jgi:hypothetical protein